MVRDQRRLAAIVSADVAGYSRLMGNDESGTLAALKAHRSELIDPKIAEYGGRIVKTTGDGLLLEFASVVDAVRCAVDVQRGMAERNVGLTGDRRIDFRIGINVGDIIIDADDIYGDGVNVAARLQALAEPGAICVSKVVRDQVLDKLSFTFEDLGPREVKNIARPIEVFRIRDSLPASTPSQQKRWSDRGPWLSRTSTLTWRRIAGAIAAITVAVIAAWYIYIQPKSATTARPPLMSVAVMPFTPASAKSDDESFSDRLTQDLTSALGRAMRYALVVSHGVVAPYRGKPIDPKAVGRDLNVGYIVEGEVRGDEKASIVTARMIETANGTQVWTARVAVPSSSDSARTSGLITGLTSGVRNALHEAERKRIARLPVADASAMELVLHGDVLWEQDPSLKGALAARKFYEEAVRLDAGSVSALLGLYWTISEEMRSGPTADHDRFIKKLDELSLRAVQADRDDPRVWITRTNALQWQSKVDSAFEANAEALRIDPDRISALTDRAYLLLITGRAEETFPLVDRAIALDPRSPSVGDLLYVRCRAHLLLGHYDDAIAACEQANAHTYFWFAQLYLIAAYAQKGDMTKAEAAKGELLKKQPGLAMRRIKEIQQREWSEATALSRESHFYAGLRKAGIPEQ